MFVQDGSGRWFHVSGVHRLLVDSEVAAWWIYAGSPYVAWGPEAHKWLQITKAI